MGTKKGLLAIVLALVIVFCGGRIAWDVAAARDTAAITRTFSEDSRPATESAFIFQIRAEVKTANLLNETCLLVAECTPAQRRDAATFLELQQKRIDCYEKYENIKSQAIEAAKAGDEQKLESLYDEYVSAKMGVFQYGQLSREEASKAKFPKKLAPILNGLV